MSTTTTCPRHKVAVTNNFGVWEDDSANNHTNCMKGEPISREDRWNWLELPGK